MKTIDNAVLAGYNAGIERDRLRTGIGLIEFERTKEILLEKLPKPPAVIYDVGGVWLAPNVDALLENEETKAVLMKTVRMLDTHEEIIGLSGHLLAVSRKTAGFS